eukprot:scaffold262684_cov32-Tisochrysis_lutea.AAC.6
MARGVAATFASPPSPSSFDAPIPIPPRELRSLTTTQHVQKRLKSPEGPGLTPIARLASSTSYPTPPFLPFAPPSSLLPPPPLSFVLFASSVSGACGPDAHYHEPGSECGFRAGLLACLGL